MAIFNKADTETVALVKKVQRETEQLGTLELDANRLDRELAEAKAAAGIAALDLENGKITRKDYEALARKVGDVDAERSQKLFAAHRLRQQLSETKQKLFEAKSDDRRREAEIFGNQREKCIAEIAAADEAKWKARQRLHAINEKITQAFGASITLQHGGTLLSPHEIQSALETELARVSSRGPLAGNFCPALPGAGYSLTGNPGKEKPIIEKMKEANALLVKRAVAGYTGNAPKPQAKPAPAPAPAGNDPDDAILQGPPVGPTVDASQIMASLGHRKLA